MTGGNTNHYTTADLMNLAERWIVLPIALSYDSSILITKASLGPPTDEFHKSACSVAATYKPPMLVPRVRLPAGAFVSMFVCLLLQTETLNFFFNKKKIGLVFSASFAAHQTTALRHRKVVPRGLEPRT